MYQLIIVVHVLLGLGVVGLILMQQGKGADAGAAFGTGASGSVFGAQGAASFLSRTTAILATLFFITSLTLAVLGGKQESSYDVMTAPKAKSEVPVAEDNSNVAAPSDEVKEDMPVAGSENGKK
ncbi:MAG: preprotein translocase subunit SecG [Methylobacter sp.]